MVLKSCNVIILWFTSTEFLNKWDFNSLSLWSFTHSIGRLYVFPASSSLLSSSEHFGLKTMSCWWFYLDWSFNWTLLLNLAPEYAMHILTLQAKIHDENLLIDFKIFSPLLSGWGKTNKWRFSSLFWAVWCIAEHLMFIFCVCFSFTLWFSWLMTYLG